MGTIPAGTKLTPRPTELQAWNDVPADAKRVYLKLMENYAEFMAHTDHEIGRLIDSLEASGELDNTLVMYVVGDNGASTKVDSNGRSVNWPACSAFNWAWQVRSTESTRLADRPANRMCRSPEHGPWTLRLLGPSKSPATLVARVIRW